MRTGGRWCLRYQDFSVNITLRTSVLTSSSIYGTNLGVDGTAGSDVLSAISSSRNIVIEPFEPDAILDFFVVLAGGGGIEAAGEFSSGPGSTKTAILGALLTEAVLFDLPACRSVVPAALLTSGAFSFTRDLRVPNSAHGAAADSGLSVPEGSTNICMRPFGRGAVLELDDASGPLKTSSDDCREDDERLIDPEVRNLDDDEEEDSPSTARRDAADDVAAGGFGGVAAVLGVVKPAIILF